MKQQAPWPMIVALPAARPPDANAIAQAHARHFPDSAPLVQDARDASSDTLVLRTPTTRFTLALTEVPIAWSELLGPCDAAWYWPEASVTLRPHAAHLRVTAENASGDTLDRMLALTRATAAIAESCEALGIYLPGSQQVHKVDDFVSEAAIATREQLPLYLWLRFSIAEENEGALTLCTSGLGMFDLMELEFPHCALDAQTLMDRAFNIAHYLLEHGPVLANGHTIGISATEKFRVTHSRSLRSEAKVYRLEQQV